MNDADFIVDGKPTTAEVAHAIPPERIASMIVTTRPGAGRSLVTITTGAGREGSSLMALHLKHAATAADSAEMAAMHTMHTNELGRTFAGVMMLDGVKVDNATMARLDPNAIASVEIIKGPEAARQSSDPAAANGLIRITTKAPARK